MLTFKIINALIIGSQPNIYSIKRDDKKVKVNIFFKRVTYTSFFSCINI